MEGGGCQHLVSTEVKAEEVITSWKNSVLCVWVWGGHSGKLLLSHLRFESAAGLRPSDPPERVGHLGIRAFALCPGRLTQFPAYFPPAGKLRMTHGFCVQS